MDGVRQGLQPLPPREGRRQGIPPEPRRQGRRRLHRRGLLVARRQEAGGAADEEGRRAQGLPRRVVAARTSSSRSCTPTTTSSPATRCPSPSRTSSTWPRGRRSPSPTSCFPTPGASRTGAGRPTRAGSRSSTTSAAIRCCAIVAVDAETGQAERRRRRAEQDLHRLLRQEVRPATSTRPTKSSGCPSATAGTTSISTTPRPAR